MAAPALEVIVQSKRDRRAAAIPVFFLACLLVCTRVWGYERDKSDVVTLKNGDHITGDIVSLEYGMLTLNTDKAGTVHIEWPSVRSVSSKFAFGVERRGGAKFYGVITTSSDGASLVVGSGEAAEPVPMQEVDRISRFSLSFWNRINGNLAIGVTYTKTGDTTVGSLNFESHYRSTAVDASLSFDANTTRTSSGDDSLRALLSGFVTFLRPSRNFWGLVGSLERDQQLGIDARISGGAVVGRRFVQLPVTELTGVAGAVVSQESVTGKYEDKTSLEGVLGVYWRVFKFTDPKTHLTLGAFLYPSFTESDRYRANGNLSLTHELIGDFTVGLTAYWSADTHPPDATAAKSDYGLTFNLGYEFGQ
jgi:hypothetical protein